MTAGAVDTAGRPPLYQQLQALLCDRIDSGVYEPGDTLPSESEFIREYSLSRITVRRAIAELQHEGLVVTRQGAGVGTFVADATRSSVQCLLSFTSDTLRRGRIPGSEFISLSTGAGPEPATRQLGRSHDAALVNTKRLRTFDDEPAYLSDAYIPAAILPDIAPTDLAPSGLDQSLFRLIERHYPVPLEDGEEVATAVFANEEVREIFELPRHSPVILKTCLLRDRNGSPIIYEEATWGIPQRSTVVWRRSVAAMSGNKDSA